MIFVEIEWEMMKFYKKNHTPPHGGLRGRKKKKKEERVKGV